MVAINFQQHFGGPVKSGAKPHTIRVEWKNGKVPWKVGKMLQLYTGLRTKSTKHLIDVKCTAVVPINIEVEGPWCTLFDYRCDPEKANFLAKNDGFANYAAMLLWFHDTHGLPCEAYLICWNNSEKLYMGEKCSHEGYNFKDHGRCCPFCSEFLTDFGD